MESLFLIMTSEMTTSISVPSPMLPSQHYARNKSSWPRLLLFRRSETAKVNALFGLHGRRALDNDIVRAI
jgi:hypothetical protein